MSGIGEYGRHHGVLSLPGDNRLAVRGQRGQLLSPGLAAIFPANDLVALADHPAQVVSHRDTRGKRSRVSMSYGSVIACGASCCARDTEASTPTKLAPTKTRKAAAHVRRPSSGNAGPAPTPNPANCITPTCAAGLPACNPLPSHQAGCSGIQMSNQTPWHAGAARPPPPRQPRSARTDRRPTSNPCRRRIP